MWWALVRQLVLQDTMTMCRGGKQCQISLTAIVPLHVLSSHSFAHVLSIASKREE